MMSFKQIKSFIVMCLIFYAIGSIIAIVFHTIDMIIGFSIGFLFMMFVIYLMIQHVVKQTDKGLSNQEDIE